MLIPALVTDTLMFIIRPHSVHVLNRFSKAGLGNLPFGIILREMLFDSKLVTDRLLKYHACD